MSKLHRKSISKKPNPFSPMGQKKKPVATIWSNVASKYEIIKPIGSGSYGEVFRAICKKSRRQVAIKLIRDLFCDTYQTRKIISEIQILRELTHIRGNSFSTPLIEVICNPNFEGDFIFLVLEHMESDLKKVLNNSRNILFSEDHVITILYNTLCCLKFLHSAGIMHRDMKPANLLVDGQCQVKLCDFGFSRTAPSRVMPVRMQSLTSRRKTELGLNLPMLSPKKWSGQPSIV